MSTLRHNTAGCMSRAELTADMALVLVKVRNLDIKSLCKLALRMHGFDRDDVEELVEAAMAKEIERRLAGGRMIWWKGTGK
jgi:hypothetical protein